MANATKLVQFFEDKGLPIVDQLGQEGVYVNISTTGGLSGELTPHHLCALTFFTDAVTQMGYILGIDAGGCSWMDMPNLSDLF